VSHVVESAASRRHRRNRRTAIILVVLVAALAGAFYYAASYMNRPSTPAAASDCPTTDITAKGPDAQVAPGQVTVNVYNSTSRAGLAADTAKSVKARGFVVGKVANDPAKKKIDGVGEVRFGANGKAASALVVALLDGATPVQDARADATVDLVIGNGFKQLNPAPSTTTAAAAAAPSPC
jgi:hypothetical protein